jgi:hypothetical protein
MYHLSARYVLRALADRSKGGFLNGSLNLPIESLYPALSTVYQLSKNAGVHHVLWYCGE